MSLKNKVPVITGAACGIGEHCARNFASQGAAVVIADLNLANAGKVADSIAAAGGKARAVAMDVTNEEAVYAGIEGAAKVFGGIDEDTMDGEFTSLDDDANMVAFLAGFESNALTGQSVLVTHGWSTH